MQVSVDPAFAADEEVDYQLLNNAFERSRRATSRTVPDDLQPAREDGMSHREIASVLEIAVTTVEGQLAIAKRRLKEVAAPFVKKNLKKWKSVLVVLRRSESYGETHKSAYPIMKDSLHTNDTETLYERLRVEVPAREPGTGQEALAADDTHPRGCDAPSEGSSTTGRVVTGSGWRPPGRLLLFLSAGMALGRAAPKPRCACTATTGRKVCNLTLEDGTHLTLNRGAN